MLFFKTGWLKQLIAGGKLSACITDFTHKNHTGFTATLHELAATERKFHRQLDNLIGLVIDPLLASGIVSVSMYCALLHAPNNQIQVKILHNVY